MAYMMRVYLLIGLFWASYLSGQGDTVQVKRSYFTKNILKEMSPLIDGDLSDPAWNQVDWSGDFIQNEPNYGAPPTEQTLVKIMYDVKNIYIAFRCFDANPSAIVNRMSRRDGFEGDWIEINIDSYFDKRTAFSFNVTAAGVRGDELVSNNGDFWDASWNPLWQASAKIDSLGWTAEMSIPFSQLRFGNDPNQIWGMQVTRNYFRNAERSYWQKVNLNAPGWVSEFGLLQGLKDLNSQHQLEIQPYVVGKLDAYPKEDGNVFRDGSDQSTQFGLDAKIGITNDLTLDLTINPDFGQVDADPGAIALDGFEIFFQERRPFFVENKNIFDFSFGSNLDNLFFSRRIGRSPQGQPNVNNIKYAQSPINSTILGAAKLSGKTKTGLSIGVLQSVTSEEYADIVTEDGTKLTSLVEPMTHYFLGRIQKDFNANQSFIGGIVTSTNRKSHENTRFLHDNAYTAGVDFRHNWHNRDYFVEGNFVFSHVRGSRQAILNTQRSIVHLFQRIDADHVQLDTNRTTLTGSGGHFRIGKSGGGSWLYSLGAYWRSPELELNDIGFLRQADDIRQSLFISKQYNQSTSWYRRAQINFSLATAYDFQGNHNRTQYDLGGFVRFQNNWYVELSMTHKPTILINTFLRGGPRWRYSEENYIVFSFGSDDRKKLSFYGNYVYSQAKENNFRFINYQLGINYQPINALNLSWDVTYELNPSKTQYVGQVKYLDGARYILGEIDQRTLSTTLRINYTINPNLSIQYYAQPFLASGRYDRFNYVINGAASVLDDRIRWYETNQIGYREDLYGVDENKDGLQDYQFKNPNFAFTQFRSNLVLRYEYLIGSEIFLVWSQGLDGSGDAQQGFGDLVNQQLFGQQANNTLLIKATYRWIK